VHIAFGSSSTSLSVDDGDFMSDVYVRDLETTRPRQPDTRRTWARPKDVR
jgi:hypothetical protein